MFKLWAASGLTGGGDALDGYAQAGYTADKTHITTVFNEADGKFYAYLYDPTRTDAEDSPSIIRPDDYSVAGVHVLMGSPYGDLQVLPAIVSGLPVEGGISGFDIVRASATTVAISKGSCLDSGGTAQLYADADATVTVPHTGALAANTIYHVYRCLLTGGTQEFRFYTTEANAEADAGVSKRRWLGFLRTNGSSQLCLTMQIRDLILFLKASENVVSAGVTTTYAAVTHSAFIPETRVPEIEYGARDASVADHSILASDDGTNVSFKCGTTGADAADTSIATWSKAYPGSGLRPYLATRQFKSTSGTLDLLIHSVRVRR